MFGRPAGSGFIAATYAACVSQKTFWAQPAPACCNSASQAVLAIPFGSVLPLRHFVSSSGVHSSSNSSRNLAWLPDDSASAAAAAPHSAEESFKAAEKAELDALVRVGLNNSAAEAVRKAWYSGHIKNFDTSPRARTLFSRPRVKETVSARRLLVHLRRILTAHQAAAAPAHAAATAAAAAAAAEAEAAEAPDPLQKQLQQLAVQSRRRKPVLVAPPGQSRRRISAQGALAAASSLYAASGKLDWGLLDIQRILAADPGLILVPVDDLSQRLSTLLNGIAPMLGPDLAVHYVHKSPRLRSILGDPNAEVQQLQERYDDYVDILGLPPRASLLAASESSHMARLTVLKFRSKLEQFVERWGSETAHATLSGQPHLLSSSTTATDSNSKALQQLLGCSEQQLERIVRKAPRVLSTQPRRIAYNLSELKNVMHPLDMDADDVRKTVMKWPHLLVANPVTIAAKLQALRELLGPQAHRLRITISQQPSLLASSTETLIARCEGLQKLLGCDKATIGKLFVKAPSVGSADLDTIAGRIQDLTKVLGLPLSEVKALCCRESSFMVLRPELVDQKLQHWADTLGVQRPAVVKTIFSYPRIITYDAAVVSAHMQLLQTLVQRAGSGWGGRQRSSTTRKPKLLSATAGPDDAAAEFAGGLPEPIEQLYGFDSEGYWRFYWEAKAALKDQHPELDAGERRMLLDEHWRQYKSQMQRQRKYQRQRQQQQAAEQHQERHQEEPRQQQQQQEKEDELPDLSEVWPLLYSRNVSGRLLLRLEYILSSGLQAQVSMRTAHCDSQETWERKFEDFNSWVQVRLQHLQQDPASEWPPVLLQKAVKWYTARSEGGAEKRGVGGTAAAQAGELSKAGRLAAKARAEAGSTSSSSSSSSGSTRASKGARSGHNA